MRGENSKRGLNQESRIRNHEEGGRYSSGMVERSSKGVWTPSLVAGGLSAAAGLFVGPVLVMMVGPCHGYPSSFGQLLVVPLMPFAPLLDPGGGFLGLALAGAMGYGVLGLLLASVILLIRRYG